MLYLQQFYNKNILLAPIFRLYKHVQNSIYYKITNEYMQVLRVLLIPNSKSETVKTCSDFSSNFVNAFSQIPPTFLAGNIRISLPRATPPQEKFLELGWRGRAFAESPLKNDPQVFVINFLERLPLKLSRLENIVSSLADRVAF